MRLKPSSAERNVHPPKLLGTASSLGGPSSSTPPPQGGEAAGRLEPKWLLSLSLSLSLSLLQGMRGRPASWPPKFPGVIPPSLPMNSLLGMLLQLTREKDTFATNIPSSQHVPSSLFTLCVAEGLLSSKEGSTSGKRLTTNANYANYKAWATVTVSLDESPASLLLRAEAKVTIGKSPYRHAQLRPRQ